jgi:hypothetical protein
MGVFAGNHFYCWNCGRELDWYEICNCTEEDEDFDDTEA